jgi:hypothetical protein
MAGQTERKALLNWLRSSSPDLASVRLQMRVVPMQFTKSETGYAFTAGRFVSLNTTSLESCANGGCGEDLWYTPRAASTAFAVGVNRASHIAEPLLKLDWTDAGKRSVFLAKFGETDPAKNIYVSSADLCTPGSRLF